MDRVVVMVDVNADEFAESPCPPQLSEIHNKPSRVTCKADDSSIDVYHKGIIAVYLCSGCKADI